MLYKPYREFLAEVFPQFRKVRKMPLNGGMSCPNLDGAKSAHGCSYCNNKSFSPVWDLAKVSVKDQIAKLLPPLRTKYKDAGILAYFQPYTNTYAPAEHLREIFAPAVECPDIAGIAVGTRPDCLENDKIALLAEMNREKPVIVEAGLQTANDDTLRRINRQHSFADFEDAVRRLQGAGLAVTTHLIVGLPGEGMDDFVRTAREVKRLGIKAAKLHPLHIVRGTQMAEEFARGEIQLLSFEEYCAAIAEMIRIFDFEVAVERFSGESPGELLLAPDWSGERDRIIAEVERILRGKSSAMR